METVETGVQDEPRSHEDDAYRWARKRAEAIQGLYIHLLVYLAVNAGLLALNWLTRGEDGPWWVFWPALGWGVGLLIHLLAIAAPVFSPEWADRRARRMLERERDA